MDAADGAVDTPAACADSDSSVTPRLGRLASQFALLGVAELVCRILSLAIVLELVRRVGRDGFGRIEFCFNLVYWLIFVIRDGVELVFYRELSRRQRPNPRIVGAYVSLKLQLAMLLWAWLVAFSLVAFRDGADRFLLCSFGVLLIPTSIGLDNVFRSRERAGIVAASLVVRTGLYVTGVWFFVTDSTRLTWVPWLFLAGELAGIALVWRRFSFEYGLPRLNFARGRRIAAPVLTQGQGILGLQLAQVALASMDVLIIGFLDSWSLVGLYGAPHRIVAAAVTFAVIFQQVLLPQLVRSWTSRRDRQSAEIRRIIAASLAVIVPGTLLVSLFSGPIVGFLFSADFADAAPLLAIGIWRVPIMVVGSIHLTALVATHREREGVRILSGCLAVAVPLVIVAHANFGLEGTACAMVAASLLTALSTGVAVHSRAGRGLARQKTDESPSTAQAISPAAGAPHLGIKSKHKVFEDRHR
jgi:O-antigen/teichoic acid export membrane protein